MRARRRAWPAQACARTALLPAHLSRGSRCGWLISGRVYCVQVSGFPTGWSSNPIVQHPPRGIRLTPSPALGFGDRPLPDQSRLAQADIYPLGLGRGMVRSRSRIVLSYGCSARAVRIHLHTATTLFAVIKRPLVGWRSGPHFSLGFKNGMARIHYRFTECYGSQAAGAFGFQVNMARSPSQCSKFPGWIQARIASCVSTPQWLARTAFRLSSKGGSQALSVFK